MCLHHGRRRPLLRHGVGGSGETSPRAGRGGSPDPERQHLALHPLNLQVGFDFSLTLVWVPRDLNVPADYVSHVSPAMRHHHHSPREEWSAYLDGLWGPHTVDRFASGRQLSQSAARRPACGPLLLPVLQTRCGVDGLPSPSRGTRTTTGSSPRVHLVGSAVTHIRACGAVTTLICPSAPWATWWPSLRERGGGGGGPRDVRGVVPLGPPARVLDVSARDLPLLGGGPMLAIRFDRG